MADMYMINHEKRMRVKIAGCIFDIHRNYEYVTELYKNYRVSDMVSLAGGIPAITVSEAEIDFEQQESEKDGRLPDREILEAQAILRKISEYMSAVNIVMYHGTAMIFHNHCYLISSQNCHDGLEHARLWKKYFGDENVQIIGGDKFFIAASKKEFFVYSTPYDNGAEYEMSTKSKLAGIVFLKNTAGSESECSIKMLDENAAANKLYQQMNVTRLGTVNILKMCNSIIKYVPCYKLICDFSKNSVRTCFEEVTRMDFDHYEIAEMELVK